MTAQTKAVLKSYFNTGDAPTEAQFADLIDSFADTTNVTTVPLPTGVAATDTANIQAVINAAILAGGGAICLQAGTYSINGINLTDNNGTGLVITGAGVEATTLLSVNAGKAAIDLCGSGNLVFSDLTVQGDTISTPTVAFLHARSSGIGGTNASWVTYRDVNIRGKFTNGAFYNFSGENNFWERVFIYSADAIPNFGIFAGAYNEFGLTSEFTTIMDTHSCFCGTIRDSIISLWGANCAPLYLGHGASNWRVRDCYIASDSNDCAVKVIGDHYHLDFDNLLVEQACADVIECNIYGAGPNTVESMRVYNCFDSNYTGTFVHAYPGVTVRGAEIDMLHGGAALSALTFDTLEYATIKKWWTFDALGTFTATNLYRSEIWITDQLTYTVTSSTGSYVHKAATSGTSANEAALFYNLHPEVIGAGGYLVLASPDGTRYKVSVANGGTIAIAPA